jgi:hypothetical protein
MHRSGLCARKLGSAGRHAHEYWAMHHNPYLVVWVSYFLPIFSYGFFQGVLMGWGTGFSVWKVVGAQIGEAVATFSTMSYSSIWGPEAAETAGVFSIRALAHIVLVCGQLAYVELKAGMFVNIRRLMLAIGIGPVVRSTLAVLEPSHHPSSHHAQPAHLTIYLASLCRQFK